jgi:fatty-acyl-CoA synthase
MPFTLPDINEAIAATIPDREAIVTRRRRVTWRELQRRTRQLGNLLIAAGLGCHRERHGLAPALAPALAPWESGQDHLALYLYNGHEYLEGMVGACRARVAPFNVNYRYIDDELLHLLRDARTRALVYHASFAPRLARVLPRLAGVLPPMALLLQVDDGSGEPLLPGAQDYEQALAAASDTQPAVQSTEDDLYIIYTGGTTGMPKGVLWRQVDIFFAALGGRVPGGDAVQSVDDIVARVPYGEMMRMLPAAPFMHNAGHWAAFITLHQGGTVIVQNETRHLDPHDIWETVERERVFTLSIVGDAFARPLVDQLRARRYDLSSLRVLGSGGAILSPSLKQALLEHLPDVVIIDGFGASETGAQGAAATAAGPDAPTAFRMDEHTVVLNEAMTRQVQPGEAEAGWLARTGHVPLGYLGDEEKTRQTYRVIDGVRYAVPGDRAQRMNDGTIRILGRDSACINSGGEKVFAEEVERALKQHPAVYDVLVTGTPSERWGQQVTAVVALRPTAAASEEELRNAAASQLARYKLPRAFVFVDAVQRTPTGKPDYQWAKEIAYRALGLG